MMSPGTIKQTIIFISKKHQKITDANSKEEFPIEERLKTKPGVKSIEDASCHEEREKRKVFAGTFGSGIGAINETKSPSRIIALELIDLTGVIQESCALCFLIWFLLSPLEQCRVVGIGSVREDKGVSVHVRSLFRVPDGDSKKY